MVGAVKVLIDSGRALNSVIVVTGSSSLKVKRNIELFPGRMGEGKNIEVLPLSFPEYLKVFGISNYKLQRDRVLDLFEQYLTTGEFPLTINKNPSTEILKAFIGDFIRFDKSLEIAKEVFASLISKIPSPLSFRTIAKNTSGYSYKTVQEYLEFFKNLYILEYAYLKQGKKVYYRKEKKIFFRDPLLLQLFSE